jgi:hypothetical protein
MEVPTSVAADTWTGGWGRGRAEGGAAGGPGRDAGELAAERGRKDRQAYKGRKGRQAKLGRKRGRQAIKVNIPPTCSAPRSSRRSPASRATCRPCGPRPLSPWWRWSGSSTRQDRARAGAFKSKERRDPLQPVCGVGALPRCGAARVRRSRRTPRCDAAPHALRGASRERPRRAARAAAASHWGRQRLPCAPCSSTTHGPSEPRTS